MVWYEEDFYAWTQEQAAALREAGQNRVNLRPPLDYENLAEEIRGLGGRDRREVIHSTTVAVFCLRFSAKAPCIIASAAQKAAG